MGTVLLRRVGGQILHNEAQKHSKVGGLLDVRFGAALMRDRRVPVGAKVLSLGIGGALIAALIAVEFPLETMVAFFLPVLGFAADVLVDGAEVLLGTLLIAALALPHVAPKTLIAHLREEKALQPAR